MYQLKITKEALRELEEEILYSINHWGRDHGRKYAKELRKQIGELKRNPRLYPVRAEILPGIRIKTFKGNRIVYTIVEKHKVVAILAIMSLYQNINQDELKQRKQKPVFPNLR